MIIPDMEKLWEPYAVDGCTIEMAMKWLKQETGVSDEVIQTVVAETFIDLAQGKEFTSHCECGCDINNAHTNIAHYMGNKCRALRLEAELAYYTKMQENLNATILAHMTAENAKFTAENMKKNPFFDWSRSETINLFKRIFRRNKNG